MKKGELDPAALKHFCEEARVILINENPQMVDLFCEGFCKLAEELQQQMRDVTGDFLEGEERFSLPTNVHNDYDGGASGKAAAKAAEQSLKLLERLMRAPEFEEHNAVLFDAYRIIAAFLIERRRLKTNSRSRKTKRELALLNLLDTSIALCFPHFKRGSYSPSSNAGRLAQALYGKRPPSDIRKRIDKTQWYSPEDADVLSADD